MSQDVNEMRAAFELWFSDEGETPKSVERNGDRYRLMQAQSAWWAWQAAWNCAIEARIQSQRESASTLTRCAADRDGDCVHQQCPQLRDGEPGRSGRHCPHDTEE